MVNHFQILSPEQDHVQMQKCPFQNENLGQNQKVGSKASVCNIWRRMEKLITLLVLVYLVILIFNLLSCRDTSLALQLPAHSQQKTTLDQLSQMQRLNSQNSKQALLQEILEESPPSVDVAQQKQDLTEIISSQPIILKPRLPQNQINQQQKIKDNQIASRQQAAPLNTIAINHPSVSPRPSSSEKENTEYSRFISEFKDKQSAKQHQQSFYRLRAIYDYLNDEQHLSIRSLPFKQTKEAINKYAEGSDSLLLHLIEQNADLNASLSQKDISYLNYLREEHLTSQLSQMVCVILSSHNNAHNQQIVRTLNSVYNQNYEPYQVVIADRASDDATSQYIKNYLKQNEALSSKTSFIQVDSESESFAAWTAAQTCKEGSLAVYLDGNTELVGKEVFNMINDYFSQFKANVVYSDYYSLDVASEKLKLIDVFQYDQSEQFMLAYRNTPRKYGRIVAFKTDAIRNVPQNIIKFNEKYFQYSGIDSLAVTLLEMSCGKIKSIDEPLGLVLVDSRIEKEQEGKRKHELRQISQKLKMDIC